MILGNVDPCLAQHSADASNYPRHVVVRKNQESVTWLHIDVESSDSCKARSHSRLCRSCNCYLLHATAQSDFDGIGIVLRWCLGSRKVDAAIFRNGPCVDEIEAFLFHRSFEQAARGRRQQCAFSTSESRP